MHGKFDSDGMLPPMTTKAQAEGAIEGVYTDYKVSGVLSTRFNYSRFDKMAQAPKQKTVKRTASTSEYEGGKGCTRWHLVALRCLPARAAHTHMRRSSTANRATAAKKQEALNVIL